MNKRAICIVGSPAKNDQFAKTGSGQTYAGKVETKKAFRAGTMDITVAQFFAPLDVSMIIIDCSWNMHAAEITAKAPKLISYLRSHGHAATPIVLVQGTTAGQAWVGNSSGAATVRNHHSFSTIFFRRDGKRSFAQTGSGQTQGKLEPKKEALCWFCRASWVG